MSSTSSGSKNHTKKTSLSREREKSRSVASESGGSSQCDTPPLNEKVINKFKCFSPSFTFWIPLNLEWIGTYLQSLCSS